MVAITEDDIRELAKYRGEVALVTSCYLDVDGGHHPRYQDVIDEMAQLCRTAKGRAEADESVAADLHRMDELVRAGIDRSRTRGLVMFACSAQGLWKVVELPVPVRSRIEVNHSPYVRPLELVVDQNERFGILLVDRQRARMFVFELGELVESSELFEQLPRGDDVDHSVNRDQVQGHAAELASQHLRHAAAVAWQVYQATSFDHLIVSTPEDLGNEVVSLLHPYLQERVAARCHIPLGASLDEIRTSALEVEAEVERRTEAEVVARLREAAGGGRKGVTGLDATLRALVERRVDTLVVSQGYEAPGWRCLSCRNVAVVGRRCPVCEAEMTQVDDVVEEAVEEALGQSCTVEMCVGNADLDVLGRIGALLRY